MAEEAEEYSDEGEGQDEESPQAEVQKQEEVIEDPSEESAAEAEEQAEAPVGEGEQAPKPAPRLEAEPEAEAEAEPLFEEQEAQEAELTPRQRYAARRAGWTAEQIAALPNALTILDGLADQYEDIGRRYGKLGKPTLSEQDLATIREKGPQAVQQDEDLTGELLMDLDPDVYGEEMVEAMTNKLLPRIKRLSDEVRMLRDSDLQRRAAQLQTQVDAFFDSATKDYGEVFGKGPIHKLVAGSPEHTARLDVCKLADRIANAAIAQGEAMGVQEALEFAVAVHTKDKALEIARSQVAASVQKRAKQAIARPTHRAQSRSYRKPEEKAADALAQKMRSMGYTPESED